MRLWWNWQTRCFEGAVPQGVRVRFPPGAPKRKRGRVWLKAAVLKTAEEQSSVGSNPTVSATSICGRSLKVKPQPSKLMSGVRFPSPAPILYAAVAQLVEQRMGISTGYRFDSCQQLQFQNNNMDTT